MDKFPSHILALAEKAGGEPFAFRETPDAIVIVFVDGRKLTFDRTQTVDVDTSIPLPPSTVETEQVPSLNPPPLERANVALHPARSIPKKGKTR